MELIKASYIYCGLFKATLFKIKFTHRDHHCLSQSFGGS